MNILRSNSGTVPVIVFAALCTGAAWSQTPSPKIYTAKEVKAIVTAEVQKAKPAQLSHLKTAYGFSDAQANEACIKETPIMVDYMSRSAMLAQVPGGKPTAAQVSAIKQRYLVLFSATAKRLRSALLSVATPAQKPRVEADMREMARHPFGTATTSATVSNPPTISP